MISTERRNKKPYAIPIQCVAYTGMTVAELRTIVNNIVSEMVKIEMKVTGMSHQ